MTIDLHCHYVPLNLAEYLRKRSNVPMIRTAPNQQEYFYIPSGPLPFVREYYDLDYRLTLMDRWGVDAQLLSMAGLFGLDALPPDEAITMSRYFNRDLAQVCRDYPGRFYGLAALPWIDLDVAVAEYRLARQELGLLGAIIPGNFFTDDHQIQKILPLFREAQKLGGHLFIHPGLRPEEYGPVPESALQITQDSWALAKRAVDVQNNVAQIMLSLLFSPHLKEFDRVSLQVANLGGNLPYVLERIEHTFHRRGLALPQLSQFRCPIYVDCASLGPRAVRLAVAVYGLNRVVMGSDSPIFSPDYTLEALRNPLLSVEIREAVLSKNGEQIIKKIRSMNQ